MKELKNSSIVPDETIINKIYYIRDQKIMLDADLSILYGVETKRLNEQVSRNIDRFPEDFMFKLTNEEFKILKSQNATSSWGGRRKAPNAFTEHGVLMLSSVLSSPRAIQVNIQVMRIFTKFRKHILDHSEFSTQLKEMRKQLHNNTQNIELVFQYLDELEKKEEEPKSRKRIGYKSDEL